MRSTYRHWLCALIGMAVFHGFAWQNWTGGGDGLTFDSALNWSNGVEPASDSTSGSLGIGISTAGPLKLSKSIDINRLQITGQHSHVFDFYPYTLGTYGNGGLALCFVTSNARLEIASGKIDVCPGRGQQIISVPSYLNVARTGGPAGEFSNCHFVADGENTHIVANAFSMVCGTNNSTTISGGARLDAYLKLGTDMPMLRNSFVLTGSGTVHSNLHVASSYDPTEYKLFTHAQAVSNSFVVANGARLERVSSLAACDGCGNSIVFSNVVCSVPSVALAGGRDQRLVFDKVSAEMSGGFASVKASVDSTVEIKDSYMTNIVTGPSFSIGHEAAGCSNALHFSHSHLRYGPYQYIGLAGTDNEAVIDDGSVWEWSGGNGSGDCYLGHGVSALRNALVVRRSQMYVNNLYGGWQGAYSRLRVEGENSVVRAAKSLYCGYSTSPYNKGGSNRWEIVDGGLLTNGTSGVVFFGAGHSLVVSNGTIASGGAITLPYDHDSSSGLTVAFAGTNPVITTSAYSHNAVRIQRDTLVRFEVPRDGYASAPIRTTSSIGDVTFGDDVTYSFDFGEFMNGDCDTCELVRISGGSIVMSATAYNCMADAVSRDSAGKCQLRRTSTVLCVQKKKGLMVIIE